MITQEEFNRYAALRQIHQRIFCVLEDYRRTHDSFRFTARKQNKKGRLTYGLIFTGDDHYVGVGLSNENDIKNKTRTVSFIFGIENGDIVELCLQVSYSIVAGVGEGRMQRYRELCQQFQIVPQELENGTRIRGQAEIALNGNDWENPLRVWLDNNFGVLKDGFADVLIDEEGFSELLENQVNRGILFHDDAGYSVNENYVPAFEVGNGDQQLEGAIVDGVDDEDGNEDEGAVFQNEELMLNLIIFGAPGTGKSHKLEADRLVKFGGRYERVTFYPTYSYAQFVGTYKPVMKPIIDDNGQPIINAQGKPKEEIAYEFVPGPFLRVLVNALNEEPNVDNKKKAWCLVIEEINRANAAAVFGDVFQLLDRGSDGVSEYSVAVSDDVKKYLLREVKTETGKIFLKMAKRRDSLGNETEEWDCSLRIPDNMYIWATMNSADQGVFPMDTAFKRRWAFKYLGLDNGVGEDGEDNWMIGMKGNKFTYKWEDFRRYVNRLLALAKVNEDKLMGPFFMKKPANGIIDKDEFESKVLMYLWEDAGKMCRRQLFGDISTYSELIDEWEEKGIEIFSSTLRDKDTIKDKGNNPRKATTLFLKLKPAADDQSNN